MFYYLEQFVNSLENINMDEAPNAICMKAIRDQLVKEGMEVAKANSIVQKIKINVKPSFFDEQERAHNILVKFAAFIYRYYNYMKNEYDVVDMESFRDRNFEYK